jgi:hypothetical protein
VVDYALDVVTLSNILIVQKLEMALAPVCMPVVHDHSAPSEGKDGVYHVFGEVDPL